MSFSEKVMQSSVDTVIEFLERNETNLIQTWEEKIIMEGNVSKECIQENGLLMYKLVLQTLKDLLDEERIKQLAFKLAEERIDAKSNIGDLVYNVNLGRSIILKYIIQSNIPIDDLEKIIDKINKQFDNFSHQAVTRYTLIKEKEIQEKNHFIQQSHKDRLSILGQISSSFVHEFRNPLTSVIGFSKLLRKELPDHNYLNIIDHELDQLSYSITQFLHTSKMEVMDNKVTEVNLGELLEDILKFLYPSIVDEDVSVLTDVDSSIVVHANESELRQVFLNILFNSIDAVKHNDHSREIYVSCIEESGKINVSITNNGPEIPVSVQETIFEPFYTTKELGTGIGLFVCKKIIQKHNGDIICQSNKKETKFTIYL
ncbi:signal transduction histidine kinase [Evansella vedderi]|uniref:histidine kinase n=1 Tax=Evansella vedderi TaxID=38282 RepID=A0ABU0A0T5_9BACI|nr:histidine kinase N-terminal domain-containing protein [Evansella vedderi]MDQ0256749.1 signal transduction histidine kinase [Evansella vedderi]